MSRHVRTIIIEDESPARKLLRSLLEPHQSIEVIAECSDGFEGAKKIIELNPDLVFLDIQMPRINGFEMLELIDRDKLPLIIFTTAFDEYAIKAFEYNTCDYLMKPLGKERFDKAILKALEQLDSKKKSHEANIARLIEQGISSQKYLERVVIRSANHIQVVQTDDLLCLEANDDYVIVHTQKDQWLKKQTLGFYEQRLNPDDFLRVHRSFIVKLSAINRLEPYSKDAFIGILKNGLKVSVSKAGYSKLKETLNF